MDEVEVDDMQITLFSNSHVNHHALNQVYSLMYTTHYVLSLCQLHQLANNMAGPPEAHTMWWSHQMGTFSA